MKLILCTAVPIALFGLVGGLLEDRFWPQHGPYVFIGFALLGAAVGAVLAFRFAPVHIITKEDVEEVP
jgi:hypothetical protein